MKRINLSEEELKYFYILVNRYLYTIISGLYTEDNNEIINDSYNLLAAIDDEIKARNTKLDVAKLTYLLNN